jgi:hypothetical protein
MPDHESDSAYEELLRAVELQLQREIESVNKQSANSEPLGIGTKTDECQNQDSNDEDGSTQDGDIANNEFDDPI